MIPARRLRAHRHDTSALVFVLAANGGSFADLSGANVPISAIAFLGPGLVAIIVSVASKTTRQLAVLTAILFAADPRSSDIYRGRTSPATVRLARFGG